MSPAVLIVIASGFFLLLRIPPVRSLTRSALGPRLAWLMGPAEPHWSKSSTTSSDTGVDWQASTKPDSISSGSSA
jgi:hypothetical protein